MIPELWSSGGNTAGKRDHGTVTEATFAIAPALYPDHGAT